MGGPLLWGGGILLSRGVSISGATMTLGGEGGMQFLGEWQYGTGYLRLFAKQVPLVGVPCGMCCCSTPNAVRLLHSLNSSLFHRYYGLGRWAFKVVAM